MAVKTEPSRLGDAIKWEAQNMYSRGKVTVASGNSVAILEVVGKISKSTPANGTADAGNTGDGTCASVTAGALAKLGTYTLTCVTAATDGGTFKVVDPDGNSLPDAVVAAAYSNAQVNFIVADGSVDFVVGDIFTIEVAAGSGKVVPLDPDAVDGSRNAAGIMVAAVAASAADAEGVIIEADAMAAMDNLVWPDGITAGEKAVAIEELEALGIKAVSLA